MALVLDGVYTQGQGGAVCHPVAPPRNTQLLDLLLHLIRRVMRCLVRQGALVEEAGTLYLNDADPDNVLAPLHAASCTYRIAFGPRKGHKVLSLQTVPQTSLPVTSPLRDNLRCANRLSCRFVTVYWHRTISCGQMWCRSNQPPQVYR